MAYMSQAMKAKLAPAIKAVLKKHNVKGTISVRHHTSLVVKIKEGALAFEEQEHVNTYWLKEHYKGKELKFLTELHKAMTKGNHDNSDAQTDYFDVGWYTDIEIGDWNKPYVKTAA
jgi:hypothetical protein